LTKLLENSVHDGYLQYLRLKVRNIASRIEPPAAIRATDF
jgi:hypothetical protein